MAGRVLYRGHMTGLSSEVLTTKERRHGKGKKKKKACLDVGSEGGSIANMLGEAERMGKTRRKGTTS